MHLGIFKNDDDSHIGFITLFLRRNDTTMLTIVIGEEDLKRQGYAFEVGRRIQKFVFDEMGYNKICAQIHEHNKAAIAYSEKLGLIEEAILRDFYKEPDLSRPSQYNMGMLKSEWDELKKTN